MTYFRAHANRIVTFSVEVRALLFFASSLDIFLDGAEALETTTVTCKHTGLSIIVSRRKPGGRD